MNNEENRLTLKELALERAEETATRLREAADQALTDGTQIQKDFETFFESHPLIEAFSWRAGTPSFNDGEPCTFSTREIDRVKLTPEGYKELDIEIELEDDDEGIEYYTEEWDKIFNSRSQGAPDVEKYNEDMMMTLFGDGVRVWAYRDGTFQTEDCYFD